MIDQALAKFLFENSPFDPLVSAMSVGFCIIGLDGVAYLTEAGEAYLEGIDA